MCLPAGGVLVGDVGNRNLRRVTCVEHCPPASPPPPPGVQPSPDPPHWSVVLVGAVAFAVVASALLSALFTWGLLNYTAAQTRHDVCGVTGRGLLGEWRPTPTSLPVAAPLVLAQGAPSRDEASTEAEDPSPWQQYVGDGSQVEAAGAGRCEGGGGACRDFP